jgi:hypothetical protein
MLCTTYTAQRLQCIQGRKGVIPPHRSAEIEFAFRPRYVCIHLLQKYTATVSESSGDSNIMLECCGMSLEAMW